MAADLRKYLKRTRHHGISDEPARFERMRLKPSEVLLAGVWFGIVTGLMELGGTLAAVKLAGRITYETL